MIEHINLFLNDFTPSIIILINNGSLNDKINSIGTHHFLEHLLGANIKNYKHCDFFNGLNGLTTNNYLFIIKEINNKEDNNLIINSLIKFINNQCYNKEIYKHEKEMLNNELLIKKEKILINIFIEYFLNKLLFGVDEYSNGTKFSLNDEIVINQKNALTEKDIFIITINNNYNIKNLNTIIFDKKNIKKSQQYLNKFISIKDNIINVKNNENFNLYEFYYFNSFFILIIKDLDENLLDLLYIIEDNINNNKIEFSVNYNFLIVKYNNYNYNESENILNIVDEIFDLLCSIISNINLNIFDKKNDYMLITKLIKYYKDKSFNKNEIIKKILLNNFTINLKNYIIIKNNININNKVIREKENYFYENKNIKTKNKEYSFNLDHLYNKNNIIENFIYKKNINNLHFNLIKKDNDKIIFKSNYLNKNLKSTKRINLYSEDSSYFQNLFINSLISNNFENNYFNDNNLLLDNKGTSDFYLLIRDNYSKKNNNSFDCLYETFIDNLSINNILFFDNNYFFMNNSNNNNKITNYLKSLKSNLFNIVFEYDDNINNKLINDEIDFNLFRNNFLNKKFNLDKYYILSTKTSNNIFYNYIALFIINVIFSSLIRKRIIYSFSFKYSIGLNYFILILNKSIDNFNKIILNDYLENKNKIIKNILSMDFDKTFLKITNNIINNFIINKYDTLNINVEIDNLNNEIDKIMNELFNF